MDYYEKLRKATKDSAPCDLFDDLSPITRVLNRIAVWIANQLKGDK